MKDREWIYKMVQFCLKNYVYVYKSSPSGTGRIRDDFYFVLYKFVYFKTHFIIRPNKTNVAMWKKKEQNE